MAEKCESGSVYFSGTVTINGCTIKGIALEDSDAHRIDITLPWGEKKNFVRLPVPRCNRYSTDGGAIYCDVCLERIDGYTCYYTVCRTVAPCSQKISVVTSDRASVGVDIDYGDGTTGYSTTPVTFTHPYAEGNAYTVIASAKGYTSASKRIERACVPQFTLTLTKEVAVATYQECGRTPTRDDSKTYIANWWKCAYGVGEKRGVCESDATWWHRAVTADAKTELGVTSIWKLSGKLGIDGDYIKIWMEGTYLGRFKWKCPPAVKKDTVICDFDVYDVADKKVTDLVAGIRYTVKAWLCKTEGGGCAEILKGCDSGCEISGETLKLFLFGQAAEVASGTTNVDGYTGFFWTPSADIAGDNRIRLGFKGSANYNASESDWKTVKVSIVIPPPPPPPPPPILKDCMICSFDIVDANSKSVNKLVVGERYTVKCNIYEKAILGCAAPSKKELIGKEIKFIKT